MPKTIRPLVVRPYQLMCIVCRLGERCGDDLGDPAANKRLSHERAEAVMAYLLSKGIEQDRLQAQGFGPDRPVADNKTEKGRAQNRRVEINLLAR